MNYLKEYYESVFYVPGMPAFEELPEDYKTSISNTLGFAGFQLNKAFNALGVAIEQSIPNWQKSFKK